MATFKAVVRTPRKDGFYQVYIRVTQNTKPGYIKTDKIVTKQMVDKHGNINDPFVNEYCARMILLYGGQTQPQGLRKVDSASDYRDTRRR